MPDPTPFHTTKVNLLYTWHMQLEHLNIPSLQAFLKSLEISYIDNIADEFFCHACELAKVTKIYNCTLQERATLLFHYICTDMVRPI